MPPAASNLPYDVLGQVIAGLIVALILGIITYKNWSKIWKYLKWLRLTFFPTSPFNIVFAIETDDSDGNRNHLKQITRSFEEQVELLGLHKFLRIKDFTNAKFFRSREEAQSYSEKNNIDLLVWGRASGADSKKSGEPFCQVNLRFTYLHPKGHRGKIGQMLLAEINTVLATRQYWHIVDSDSFQDTQIISSNLTDVSLYILGLTMLLFGKIQESTNIFEKLLAKNISKSDALLTGIKHHLVNNYEIKLSEFKENSRDFREAIIMSNKLLKIDEQNLIGLAAKATSHVHFEQYDEGEKCVNDLLKYHPLNSVSIVDAAYYCVLRKKYAEAVGYYKKLINVELEFYPPSVSKFLEDQYEKHRDCGFLFASGFIDYHLADKSLGIQSLRKFLQHEDSKNEEYREMKELASQLIGSNE